MSCYAPGKREKGRKDSGENYITEMVGEFRKNRPVCFTPRHCLELISQASIFS
jgi:hypothetical protein